MGISYSRSSSLEDVEDPDQEMERPAADEFMYETEHLREMIDEMNLMDEITGEPTSEEIHLVHLRLFSAVMEGTWNATEDGLKQILFDAAPRLRGG